MGRQKGFTLVELLVVVAIVGIIAAIAVPSLIRARNNADQEILFGRTFKALYMPPSDQQRVILQPLVSQRLSLACGNRVEDQLTEPPTTDPLQIQQRLNLLRDAPPAKGALPSCSEIKPLAVKYGFAAW